MKSMKAPVTPLIPLMLDGNRFRRLLCLRPVENNPQLIPGHSYAVERMKTINGHPCGKLILGRSNNENTTTDFIPLDCGSFEPFVYSVDEQPQSAFDWAHVRETLREIDGSENL